MSPWLLIRLGMILAQCLAAYESEGIRVMIKEVVRFSGMHFVKRGRLDWMISYFVRHKGKERISWQRLRPLRPS